MHRRSLRPSATRIPICFSPRSQRSESPSTGCATLPPPPARNSTRLTPTIRRLLTFPSPEVQETDAAFGHQVRHLLARQGGVETLTEQVETVSAWHNKNDLPLLWPIHARYRNLLFQLLDLLDIRSATQDASLLDALSLVRRIRHARRDEVLDEVDLGFAAERWQRFVVKPRSEPAALDRRALEVCVFVHLAAALQAGDVYVVGSESFADYRAQLLPWEECEPRLAAYCVALGIPARGRDFAAALRRELTAAAAEVDAGFEANMELSIDPEGTPHLKQLATTGRPDGLAEFEQEVQARMPERHLLDILKNAEHWARFTRHFGPPSGSDPKLARAVQRYLFTVFGYGCNLGPNQTARHAPEVVTAQALRRESRIRSSFAVSPNGFRREGREDARLQMGQHRSTERPARWATTAWCSASIQGTGRRGCSKRSLMIAIQGSPQGPCQPWMSLAVGA